MKLQKKNESGITHHLFMTVLVVGVLGLVGFAGYRVVKERMSAKAENNATINGYIYIGNGRLSEDQDAAANDMYSDSNKIDSVDASPSGSDLHLGVNSSANGTSLDVFEANGRNRKSLRVAPIIHVSTRWSPDEKYIAFAESNDSSLTTNSTYTISIIGADGTGYRQVLTSVPLTFSGLSWKGDSQTIVYTTNTQACTLLLSDSSNSCVDLPNTANVTSYSNPDVSKDGSKILITRTYYSASLSETLNDLVNWSDVLVLSSTGSEISNISQNPIPNEQNPRSYYSYGRWSPDNQKIVMSSFGSTTSPNYTVNNGTFVMLADGTGKKKISNSASAGKMYWAPMPKPFYNAVTPKRLVDTRTTSGSIYAGKKVEYPGITVKILGEAGIPTSNVSSVVLAVTSVKKGSLAGDVSVVGASDIGARSSFLGASFTATDTRAAKGTQIVVEPDTNGNIVLMGSSAEAIVDVIGYYSTKSISSPTFTTPTRVADTRSASGLPYAGKKIASQATLTIQISGQGGVPAGATNAILNITNVGATSPGHLTVFPAGTTRPTTSFLNYIAQGSSTAKQTYAQLSSTGAISIFNGGTAATDVIVDVIGYYTPTKTGLNFVSTTSISPVDSNKVTLPNGYITSGAVASLQIAGNYFVPKGAKGVVLHVKADSRNSGNGHLKFYAVGDAEPRTSALNYLSADTNMINQVDVKLSADGKINIKNTGSATTTKAYTEIRVLGFYY